MTSLERLYSLREELCVIMGGKGKHQLEGRVLNSWKRKHGKPRGLGGGEKRLRGHAGGGGVVRGGRTRLNEE